MVKRKHCRCLVLIAVLITMSFISIGCHTITALPRPPEKTYVEKIPLDAGLYISKELNDFKVSRNLWGDQWTYPNLGTSSATMFQIGLSQIFRSLEKVDKRPPCEGQKTKNMQIVVEPAIEKFDFNIPFTKFQVYPARIHYLITIFDMNGETIFTRSIEGIGDTRGTYSFNYEEYPSKAASRAVEDGVDKALEEIIASEELKKFIAEQKEQ